MGERKETSGGRGGETQVMCGEGVTWAKTAHTLLEDVLQMLSSVGHLEQVAALISVRHGWCEECSLALGA